MSAKLFSGRFWLTIITGIVFAYVSINGLLESQAVASIITAVFLSYFQRADREPVKPIVTVRTDSV